MAGAPSFKYADLKALLAGGRALPSIVLLLGPEPFFKEEALGLIAAELERRSGGGLNKVVLDGGSVELEAVPAMHFTASLFGGEKLVVIRGFDRARASDKKSFLAAVGSSHFPESLHLLIVSEELKAGAAELKPQPVLAVTFWVPFASDLVRWLESEFARFGVRPARGVADRLYRMHGKAVPWKTDLELDMFRLAASIERLARHASAPSAPAAPTPGSARPAKTAPSSSPGQPVVDDAMVTAVLGRGDPPDVFRLVELIGKRDRAAAFAGVRHYLAETQESPIGLVALLLDRFQKLIRVAAAVRNAEAAAWQDAVRRARSVEMATRSDVRREATAGLSAALSALGPHGAPFDEIKDFQKASLVLQCAKYNSEELQERFGRLVKLDRKLKSGAGDERAELELFVAGL